MIVLLLLLALGGTTVHAQEGRDHLHRRFDEMRTRRTPAGVTVPSDARSRAITAARTMESKLDPHIQVSQPTWRFMGPRSTAGRIKSIVVDPQTPNRIYVGAAAGGVWRSTDAGMTWTPCMDDANAMAMGTLCLAPDDPSTIYAGTGEQVVGANIYLGAGILRSTDGGTSWSILGLTHVGSFSRILIHPSSPQRIIASAMNENAGIYRSDDGGSTWTRVLDGQIYDLAMRPDAPDTWIAAVRGVGLRRTTDGGASWTTLPQPLSGTPGRVSVAIAASSPDRVVALWEIDDLAAIAVSNDGGTTWRVAYRDTEGCFFAGTCRPQDSQGFYDNVIAVDPRNADLILAGGIDIVRSSDGGSTWENVTNGYGDADGNNHPHVDQHAIAFDPHLNGSVYVGNDGGLMHSLDGGRTYSVRNDGLAVTQFYGFDTDAADRDRVYGGTQDNGTIGTDGAVLWDTVQGGDGMTTIIDPLDPSTVYGMGPNGALFRVDTRTMTSRRIMSGLNTSEDCAWVAPLVHEPTITTTLYTGRQRVYRTDSRGDQWQPIGPAFTGTVTALAISPADETLLWAGGSFGELVHTTDNGATWTNCFRAPLGQLYVSAIACANTSADVAWVAYGSYGHPQVFKTTDRGRTWTSVWTGMPDVPVNALVVHPDDDDEVYAGTDIGVFVTFDGGRSWQPFGTGLPRSPVLALRANGAFSLLRAATHGRGIWEAPFPSASTTDPVVVVPAGGEVYSVGTTVTVLWDAMQGPVTIALSLNDGATWTSVADAVNGSSYRWTVPGTPSSAARVRITPSSGAPGAMSRPFTIRTPERGTVLGSRAMAWTPYGLAWDGAEGLWTTDIHGSNLYKLDRTTLDLVRTVPMVGVGDSLFTDLTFDRATGTVYVHRLNDLAGSSTTVFVLDTNGTVLRSFPSQARRYGTGLEFMDGALWATERDGEKRLVRMSAADGALIESHPNPFAATFGPRCFADDGNGNLVQICTAFPPGGGKLTTVLAAEIGLDGAPSITDSMVLASRDGLINARGIEIDRRDETMWVSDIDGVIWKVAGMRFTPPLTSVNADVTTPGHSLWVHPNPSAGATTITVETDIHQDVLTISLLDLAGRIVRTYPPMRPSDTGVASLRIDAPDLAPGTYLIRVSTSTGSVSTRTFVRLH
jgi:photosystem II stability/assembly factor-like uncharacterized protein